MSEPIWHKFLTERDRRLYAVSVFGTRQGLGKRPAILIVDVNHDFCGERPEPLFESIKRWPLSCGEEAWAGIGAIRSLLAAGRARGLPVIYTTGARRPDNWDAGSWGWKNSQDADPVAGRCLRPAGNDIIPDVAPQPRDIVIAKQKPSAFFGTPLLSYLVLLGADSLILAGTTTSGCVRATAIDAFSNNYRVAVVEEGCFDRSESSHALSLCDMHAKYADVLKLDEVTAFIAGLPQGMFDLPQAKELQDTRTRALPPTRDL